MMENKTAPQRERLSSRLGFILLSAGCAIGIGNVWKFPWLVGQNGGGAFVLVYLFFLFVMGVPVMTMEFAMGRAAQTSPIRMYQKLEPKGTYWHFHGIVSLIGNYCLMMFYTTVCGWMFQYFVRELRGDFAGMDAAAVSDVFSQMLKSPGIQVGYMAVVVVLGFFICGQGLQNGLERVTKVMMSVLLIIMVFLAVHSCFLPGGSAGLSFYLLPDLDTVRRVGILNIITAAMTQSFFTLSIGIGAMAIFGSYIGRDRALNGEAVRVSLLDTFVAVMSGLIIFPACFSYGVEPDSGPSLIFITLPNLFNHMAGGRFFGALFFVFMSFAAFSTVLAVFENIIAMERELHGWSRKKACCILCAVMFLLSLPCALGFNVLSFVQPLGAGTTFLDLEDFVTSNLLLPFGALLYVFFCTRKNGWGYTNFLAEANTGKGLKFPTAFRFYFTWILPVLILIVMILGLV